MRQIYNPSPSARFSSCDSQNSAECGFQSQHDSCRDGHPESTEATTPVILNLIQDLYFLIIH